MLHKSHQRIQTTEFCKTDNAKTDDQSATMRFYRCNVRNMIKLLEITSALILVFWRSTTRIPISVELLIEFTKQLGALLLSTPSVFLIGNAIVVALVGSFQSSLGSRNDFYEEFVVIQSRVGVLIECGEVEDLGVCSETSDSADLTASAVSADVGDGIVLGVKCYRRTKSETIVGLNVERSCGDRGLWMKREAPLSEVSSRQTVEAFIAMQQRFVRNENMALVVSN